MYPLLRVILICGVGLTIIKAWPITTSVARTVERNTVASEYVAPVGYFLNITPNFNTFTFEAQLSLEFQIQLTFLSEIVLLSEDLIIDEVELESNLMGEEFECLWVTDTVNNLLTITTDHEMRHTIRYYLMISYRGDLRDDGLGIYRNSYTLNNQLGWYAATNFFPQHAKKAFPNLERISTPTYFRLIVNAPPAYNVISNTAATINEEENGLFSHEFATTPSLTLNHGFAFIIGQFGQIYSSTSPVPVTLYSTRTTNDLGNFAGIRATLALSELQSYTEIGYNEFAPNTRIDIVALPDRHQSFATEGFLGNWEPFVTFDSTRSSVSSERRVILAVTKQISSQWYGNMIAERTYSHSWIFEALQTFFQYYISDRINPNMGFMDQFNVEVLQKALDLDANINVSPVAQPDITNPVDASEVITELSGPKGASVYNMLMHLMGEEHFQEAQQLLCSTQRREFITDIDIYTTFQNIIGMGNVFEDYPGLMLIDFMGGWLSNPGYPVVTVHIGGAGNIIATQERFFDTPTSAASQSYLVPLTWTRRSAPNFDDLKPRTILGADNEELETGLEENEWIIANIQQSGLYRVNYDEQLWERIVNAMSDQDARNGINRLNRAQILDDAINLARSGRVSFAVALDLSETLSLEREYVVWAAAVDDFRYLIAMASGIEQEAQRIRGFLRVQAAEFLQSVDYTINVVNNPLQTMARSLAMELACEMNDNRCVTMALELFQNGNLNSINANLRPAVFCTAVRALGSEAFDTLLALYQQENLYSEQVMILRALGCSNDPEVARAYLEMTASTSNVIPTNDRPIVFDAVVREFGGNIDVAIEFLLDRASVLMLRYGGIRNVKEVFTSLIYHIHSDDQVASLERLVNMAGLGVALPENGLNMARANVQWTRDNMDSIQNWMRDNGYNSAGLASYSFILIISMLIGLFLY